MDKDAVRIITTGYPSLDFILHAHNLPRVGETGLLKTTHTALRGQPGGCAANIAVACTRLGVKTGIIVQLGRDKTGDDFVRELEHEGVDCRLVRRIEGAASSTCLLVQDPQGNHQTFFYAGAAETNQFVPPDISGKPSWVVLTVGNPRTNLAVAEWAKEEGIPLCASFRRDRYSFPPELISFLTAYSRVIVMNEGEADWITEQQGVESVENFLDEHTELVVVTRGGRGSSYYCRSSVDDRRSSANGSIAPVASGMVKCDERYHRRR